MGRGRGGGGEYRACLACWRRSLTLLVKTSYAFSSTSNARFCCFIREEKVTKLDILYFIIIIYAPLKCFFPLYIYTASAGGGGINRVVVNS